MTAVCRKACRSQVEVGYSVAESARGQGWATDALRALSRWALAQPKVELVFGRTEPDNIASQRVMLKAGFRRVGEADGEGLIRFELKPQTARPRRELTGRTP